MKPDKTMTGEVKKKEVFNAVCELANAKAEKAQKNANNTRE